jgi:hypothetical protein
VRRLKKDEFKPEPSTRIGFAVSGVIPPFGLHIGVGSEIARQRNRLVLRSVAQSIGFADKRIGDDFKKIGGGLLGFLKKS